MARRLQLHFADLTAHPEALVTVIVTPTECEELAITVGPPCGVLAV
jgi:hypothetical protein